MLFSTKEVIEQAVQTEKLGYEFYIAMAEKFKKDEDLKTLFDFLATKELQHEKIFSELISKVSAKEPEGWEEVAQYLRAIVESEFFLGNNKSLPSLEHVKTVTDAAAFALNFEKETLLYFHILRDMVEEKNLIDEIINEERSHVVWLSKYQHEHKTGSIDA